MSTLDGTVGGPLDLAGSRRSRSRGPRARDAAIVGIALLGSLLVGVAVSQARLTDLRWLLAILGGGLVVVAAVAGLQRLVVFGGGLVFVVALQLVYVDAVVPGYGYTGLIDPGADPLALALVTAIAALPLLWMPIALRRPSEVVLWFFYLVGYVPTVIMPIYVLGPDLGRVLPLDIVVAIGFGAILLMQRIPRRAMGYRGLPQASFDRYAFLVGLASLGFLFAFFGIPTSIPDFASVYDARADFAQAQSGVPGAGYLVAWAGNVVFPILLALGLVRRRIPFIAVGAVGLLAIYSLQGAKATLFAIVLVPLVAFGVRWVRDRFGTWMVWGALFAILAVVVLTAVTGSLWPIALSVVRLVALPGQLTAYYYDFFTTHEPYLLSHSVFRSFVDATYPVDPPFLIGGLYLHSVVDANANIWADSMANFGLLGILPFSILLGGLLWAVDSVAERKDLLLTGPAVAMAAFTIANGALLTAVLTNGIALLIVAIALMPSIHPSGGDVRASVDGSAPG